MGHNISESSVRVRGSPRRRSPSRRERSPVHHRSSQKTRSPLPEKPTSRTKSPRRRSPEKSPSPQTKRLRKAQAQRESEKVADREYGRDHYWEDERSVHRERHADRQVPNDKEHGRNHNREDGRVAHRERVTDRQVRDDERKGRRSGRDVDIGVLKLRHGRSFSPSDRHLKSRHRSRSPYQDTDKSEVTGSRGAEHRGNDTDSVAKMKAAEEALTTKEKQKPSFELSGKLAAETNRVRGVTLLFNEPPDAKKPEIRWRLYVFKGGEMLNDPLYVHRQSCYLFGRERRVADIPTDHPSCSKQHAVLQYRQVEKEQPDGTMLKQVSPYLMDLGSTNGTFINDVRIEPQRYYELFEKDTIKFGNSSREYVLLHENSA